MIALILTAFAGGRTCEYRGLPMEVSWDAAGHVAVLDAGEPVLTVEVGPLPGVVVGSCRDDGLRLVADEATGRFNVTTLQVDFGAAFDDMPERFLPDRVQTLAGERAAAVGDWAAVARALVAGARQEAVLDAVIRQAGTDGDALEAARAALPASDAVDGALARAHLVAGRLDAARALVPPDSVIAGEILWAEGERGPARRIWMAAAARGVVLPEDVRARCPRCADRP